MIQTYSLNDFHSLQRTYDWYKQENSLLYDDEAEVWRYLNVVSSPETPLHEEQIPLWSKARGSRKNRCFVVKMDGDSVLVTYKVIALMKSRFIHVLNIPISLNGIKENVKIVISELRRDGFVRFLHYECFKEYYGKSERADNYDNYYIDLDEFKSSKMDSNKWRKRHHVNAFLKRPDLFEAKSFDCGMNDAAVEKALQARREWRAEKMLSKKANGSDGTIGGNPKKDTLEKAFISLLRENTGNVKSTMLECNGKAFALEVSLSLNGYAFGFFVVHAGRRRAEDLERKHIFHDSISIVRYFQYRKMVELNLDRFYILGSGGEPNLSAYKMQACNGNRIKCYIDKNK